MEDRKRNMQYKKIFEACLRSLILVLLVACSQWGLAQSRPSTTDSLKLVVKELRHRLLIADSTGSTALRAELRVALAHEVKPPEAIKLLQQAADTLHRIGSRDLEIAARSELAEELRKAGKANQAYAELLQVRGLIEAREHAFRERSRSDSTMAVARTATLTDSLANEVAQANSSHEVIRIAVAKELRTWQWVAMGVGVLWLVSVALLLYRIGRVQRGSSKAISEFQVKVRTLEERPTNVLRGPKEEPSAISVAKEIPSVLRPEKAPIDPMVLGMFRKQAPERLATLRAALGRGDLEKAVRVIHSLKPQLVAIDAERYSPLCATITAADPRGDQAAMERALDEFQQQVERSLSELKDQ